MAAGVPALPKEILDKILYQLEPDPDELVPVDRRRFLSQESLDRPAPPRRSCVADIGHFRLACKLFADVGAPLLFTRVVIRFNREELQRLETLATWPVARHVKRFSYVVSYFFKNHGKNGKLSLPRTVHNREMGDRILGKVLQKADQHQRLMDSHYDARVIYQAVAAFTSLQHSALRNLFELDWTPACYHCSRTVGTALRAAGRQGIRFSYPKLSPQNASFFASQKLQSISAIAASLTSLTLQFEEVPELDHQVSELNELFRTVFTTAQSMKAIHVGFLTPQPLDLPLEAVFQNVTWRELVAFGIQGWNLEADDILNFANRHRCRLRGLRLRKVFLKEGSLWKELLAQLKHSLNSLEWISLTGIGYTHGPSMGAEEIDDDDENKGGQFFAGRHSHNAINGNLNSGTAVAGPSNHRYHANADFDDDDFYADADSEDEIQEDVGEIEDLDLNSPDRPSTSSSGYWDDTNLADADDILDDDGGSIHPKKAKQWEKWVVSRSSVHGRR